MRIALIGWDLDEGIVVQLTKMGAEVVGFTRWFPDQQIREDHDGWTKIRCPHTIGGSARDESQSFAVSVVRAVGTSGIGLEFDVIHALDHRARAAAAQLAARIPTSIFLASHGTFEEGAEEGDRPEDVEGVDHWICDHPWTAECLRARLGWLTPVDVVLTDAVLESLASARGLTPAREEGHPSLVVSLDDDARVSARVLIAAVRKARTLIEGLTVTVVGIGAQAEVLHDRLERHGLATSEGRGSVAPSLSRWNAAILRAVVVGLATRRPVDHPVGHYSWLVGRPVVRLLSDHPESLARAISDAVLNPRRRDHDVQAGAALVRGRLTTSAVAGAWMRLYLETLDRKFGASLPPGGRSGTIREPRPLGFPELRSRLTLIPLSTREVLASWCLRPDDWNLALEWLGPEAVRAVLTVRLFDVTDVMFNGLNAHGFQDVTLGFGERHHTIGLSHAGRSLAGCLGVRTPSGYFHPIAHARICQMPREELAPSQPIRELRVLPGLRRP